MENDTMRAELLRVLGAGATLKVGGNCYGVLFDNAYLLVGDIEERAPVATMRSSDVTCAKLQKDVIVEVYNPFDESRKNYRVKRFEPDGTGMTLVVMKAA